MTTFGSRFLVTSLFVFLAAANTMADLGDKDTRKVTTPDAVQSNDDYHAFLISNIFNYYGNNGDGSYNKYTSNGAFEFPKGTNKTAVFEDGMLWGGFHKGRARPKVGGSVYRHGLQAGRILTPGGPTEDIPAVADDPLKPEYRVYCVRPDISPKTSFAAVQALINSEEVRYISRFEQTITAQRVYDQYLADWNEWPAANGAPFTDVDSNGTYDPTKDIPGVTGAGQTLWYVANDLNATRVSMLTGSPPIGLEMQRTIWGYKRSGDFGNVIFQRTLLINKSGAPIDSMYITEFSDSDLGDSGDDLVGCDTTLALGYTYNGRGIDATYGVAVPAVGYMLLQGPTTPGSASDTAWIDARPFPGFRNIGMTAFLMFSGGLIYMSDPAQGPDGDTQWYKIMHGIPVRIDTLLVDPTTGKHTPVLFPGDPVTRQGWIDGAVFTAQDRRLAMSSGPFTMANGDTQSILIAQVIGQGLDRLSSITALKETSRHIRTLYNKLHAVSVLEATAHLSFLNPQQATIAVTVDARYMASATITADLTTLDGTKIADVPLFDDGTHGDQLAGDHILGGWVTMSPQPKALFLNATVTNANGPVDRLERLIGNITTALPLEISLQRIFADNLNNDLQANPWEEIRFGVTTHNMTPFDLTNVAVRVNGKTSIIPSLPSQAVDTMRYEASDPTSYFEYQIVNAGGSVAHIPASADDPTGNIWGGDIAIAVERLPFVPQPEDTAIHHVTGGSSVELGLTVLDPALFRNHLYAIRGVDSVNEAGEPGLTLRDSTDGRILFLNYPLTSLGNYTSPVIDGYRILTGADSQGPWGVMDDWDVPAGIRRWSWPTNLNSRNLLQLEGFQGTMGNAREHWPSGGVPMKREHNVLIRFATTDSNGVIVSSLDQQASVAYRYLDHADQAPARPEFTPFIKNPSSGFAYQDFTRSLPFAAYDVTVSPPVRLAVGFLENNVPLGRVDGMYWPPLRTDTVSTTGSTGPREWFFIFDMPYSVTPSPTLQTDIWNNNLPIMWIGYPSRRISGPFSPNGSEDQFLIKASTPPSSNDLWIFRLYHDEYLPATYELLQNFPNPFNPGTQIRYRLREPSKVVVKIYDLLGREVRTLVDETSYAGEFTVRWEGIDNRNQRVASGVYFYRIQAEGARTKAVFGEVKKMLLLR